MWPNPSIACSSRREEAPTEFRVATLDFRTPTEPPHEPRSRGGESAPSFTEENQRRLTSAATTSAAPTRGLLTVAAPHEPAHGAPTFLSAWTPADAGADKNVGVPTAGFMTFMRGQVSVEPAQKPYPRSGGLAERRQLEGRGEKAISHIPKPSRAFSSCPLIVTFPLRINA